MGQQNDETDHYMVDLTWVTGSVFHNCDICSAPVKHTELAKWGILSSIAKTHRSKKQGVEMWVDSLKVLTNNLLRKTVSRPMT